MPFHLTAIETKHRGNEPRAPQIIASGSFDFCYDYGLNTVGGRSYNPNEPEAIKNNRLPMFITPDWVYYIISDAFQGQGAVQGVKS